MHVSYFFKKVVKVCLVWSGSGRVGRRARKFPQFFLLGQQNNLRLYWISFFLCVICEYIYSNVLCRSLRVSHLHFEGIDLRYRQLSILIGNAVMGNLYNAMRRMLGLARGEKLTKITSHEKLHINSKVLVLSSRCFKKYLCIFFYHFSLFFKGCHGYPKTCHYLGHNFVNA